MAFSRSYFLGSRFFADRPLSAITEGRSHSGWHAERSRIRREKVWSMDLDKQVITRYLELRDFRFIGLDAEWKHKCIDFIQVNRYEWHCITAGYDIDLVEVPAQTICYDDITPPPSPR